MYLAVGQRRLAADLGLGDALDLAIEKIMGAGGEALRRGFEEGRTNILVDVDPWMRSGEQVPLLPRIHDGVSGCRRLRLGYRDSDGEDSTVLVDPLGLVAKAGVWYLVATRRPRSGEPPRLYRVSRIRSCEIEPEPAQRPAGFDLAACWASLRRSVEHRRRGLDVTLAVDPKEQAMVRRLLAAQLQPDRGQGGIVAGRPVLRLAFAGLEHAVGSLLGLGTRVEVIDPPEVRRGLREAARALSELYAN
jgi:predicted DNA-binding transcriptional regulator YafY